MDGVIQDLSLQLVLTNGELPANSGVTDSNRQSLRHGLKWTTLRSKRHTFFAELLESVTIDVRPPRRAPYVSWARGYGMKISANDVRNIERRLTGSVTTPSLDT